MENFRPSANDHPQTTIHHAITTKTPRKKHPLSHDPLKKAHKTPKTTLSRRPQFFLK
jgi:hypothetical protein